MHIAFRWIPSEYNSADAPSRCYDMPQATASPILVPDSPLSRGSDSQAGRAAAAVKEPNRIHVADLNDIDQRILRESFRVARMLQQRMQLDYQR